ncbi:Na/Pi cotransporter family protein [Acinetobacter sp. S40]|uniref:Na/Pi cotransporter family protein n=1 Tax=unclassified Acinetobacter TaxID=196816 RepID=UPI00190E2F6E|nr:MULTISPECIES: Na/Pi symporter [unclassified Acinetobacter]MBJ9986689.1 Na/Pi cotransporter family protein [Acinetobacter sp. S40]MBK0063195.1 Na/Pi cotransporter family protein [Acinetobacter sp. S55]MBK0066893.1 Na/Pi cotransporter family protein [Acinetobacter sp. S54]
MLNVIVPLMGGIGLFLLGMSLMTDSLKAIAGEALRQWLVRFTSSPMKAVLSGIGLTVVVQSSTATTLATIGFVSAGVLSFSHAIGVIIGANIGTTSTGWMVALLGLKFSISSFALPLIGIGALLKLLGKEKIAFIGLTLAGFGLLFFGIQLLQDAMSDVAELIDLSRWAEPTLLMRLFLVLIGIFMTIVLQSSSAAITTTLAALSTQTINLEQTLALVIGQNIGTVATAVLAAIGATTSAKRTAAVHVIFNIVTAFFAFILLSPAFVWAYNHIESIHQLGSVLLVAAFHTSFSLLGACIFMPLLPKFEQLIMRLLPEKEHSTTRYLDESLYSVPALAIAAVERALLQSISDMYCIFVGCIQGRVVATLVKTDEFDYTLGKIENYLDKMSVPQSLADQHRLVILLRLVVYVRVLKNDLSNVAHIETIQNQRNIDQLATQFAIILEQYIPHLLHEPFIKIPTILVGELVNFAAGMQAQQELVRQQIIEVSSSKTLSATYTLEQLAAQRWLEHLVIHCSRVAVLLGDTEQISVNEELGITQ